MSVLETNLMKIKEKITSCTVLTKKILGLIADGDYTQHKLWDWRDNYDTSMTFNETKIDTGIPQTDLVNGYTIIIRAYPTNYSNFRGIFGLMSNEGGPGSGECGICGLQFALDTIHNSELMFYHYPYKGTDYTQYRVQQVGIPTEQFPVNNWYIFAVTYDGINTGKGYVNGRLIEETSSFQPLVPYNNITIGITLEADSNRYFKGQISDFQIYNKCLTQEEIEQAIIAIKEKI